jgi:hypothetical protein
MTVPDYIAIGVLIVLIPWLLRLKFARRNSRVERTDEKPKD